MLDELEALSIFKGLSEDDLQSIALFAAELDLDDGEIIISEDSKDSFDLYLLVQGSIEIVAKGKDPTKVSEEVVISKQDKDIFGEIGWLFQEKRTATVRSYGSSKIVQVNGDNLRRYLADHPDAGYRLMTHMSHHLARTVTETSNLLKQVLWLI